MDMLHSDVSQLVLLVKTFIPEVQRHMEASEVSMSSVKSLVEGLSTANLPLDPKIILERALSKPDALRVGYHSVIASQASTYTPGPLQSSKRISPVRQNMFGCRCKPRRVRRGSRLALGPALFQSENSAEGLHASDCPLAGIVVAQRYWSLGASLRVFRTVLTTAVAISMSTPFGAGGLGISPSFKAYFVYDNSPAATVINILRLTIGLDPASVSIVVQKGIEVLQSLFATGKASPLDRDSSDKTLLHHACMLTFMQESSDITKISPLLDFLVRIGVPRDRPNNSGE